MITTSRALNLEYRTAKGITINLVVKSPNESLPEGVIKSTAPQLVDFNVLGVAEGTGKNDPVTTYVGAAWIVVVKDQITLPN